VGRRARGGRAVSALACVWTALVQHGLHAAIYLPLIKLLSLRHAASWIVAMSVNLMCHFMCPTLQMASSLH
jgi:uncharacterized protein involved in cysteine biosynthesis